MRGSGSRTWRTYGINHRHGYAAHLGCTGKIRPQLGLHQDNGLRFKTVKTPPRQPQKVKGGINHAHAGNLRTHCRSMPRSRTGSQHGGTSAFPEPRPEKLESQHHFTHAHGMHIQHPFRLPVIGDPYSPKRSRSPVPNPPLLLLLKQIGRQRYQPPDGIQDIVAEGKQEGFHLTSQAIGRTAAYFSRTGGYPPDSGRQFPRRLPFRYPSPPALPQ